MAISLTGFLALFLLLITMVPPLRFMWIDRLAAGLPRAFKLHHILGIAAVAMALIHGTAAMAPYWLGTEQLGEFLGFIFDVDDPVIFFGSVAFLLLLTVVVSSVGFHLRRHLWISIHRLSVLGFALVCLHCALVWSSEPFWQDSLGALRLLGASFGVGIGAFLAIHFIYPELLSAHSSFTVKQVTKLAPDIVRLTISLDKSSRIPWRGGEFGFFRFDCRGPCGVSTERHPFTIAAAHSPTELEVVVKAIGDDTQHLQQIIPGTVGEIAGPYGSFADLGKRRNNQLWIAGGIGILPFLGLLRRSPMEVDSTRDIDIIYLTKANASALFLAELQSIAHRKPRIYVHHLIVEDPAAITTTFLDREIPDWQSREIAIAGPHGMIDHWVSLLKKRGISQSSIITEEFPK